MNRTILVEINGSYVRKDNKIAGVQGEANSTILNIVFDETWSDYTKKITFWDAKGMNPVEIVLTGDLLTDLTTSLLDYMIPIPGEPLVHDGNMTFVIEGYVDGVRRRSVADSLEVKYAPVATNAGTAVEPTPTQIEQLQGQIDNMLGDIQAERMAAQEVLDAVAEISETTSGYVDAAKESADNAKASEQSAEAIASAAKASEVNALESERKALESEQNALEHVKMAQSWAVGGTGVRGGEDADNAMYWAMRAKEVASGDFVTTTQFENVATMTDREILTERTILEWANSLKTNASKLIDVTEHAPSDLPVRQSGFVTAMLGPAHIKVVFTPYAWFNGMTFSRDIYNGTYLQDWETSVSPEQLVVYLDAENGDDFNDGQDPTRPMKTISGALKKFKGARGLNLALASGVYDEGKVIQTTNYVRFGIYRNGEGTVIIKGAIHSASAFTRLTNIQIDASELDLPVIVNTGNNLILDHCTVSAKAGYDIVTLQCGVGFMNNTHFINGSAAIVCANANVSVVNGSITGSNVGLISHAGVITHGGLVNNAATAQVTYFGGQIFG